MEPVSSLYSHLPWFEVFYKLLNTVGDLLAQDQVRAAPSHSVGIQPPPHEAPSPVQNSQARPKPLGSSQNTQLDQAKAFRLPNTRFDSDISPSPRSRRSRNF